METAHHGQSQRALAREHLIDAVAAADKWNEITRREALLIHVVLDRLDRSGRSSG